MSHSLCRSSLGPWRAALACALLAGAGLAQAQTAIKRWVDERGVVHYGDAVPAAQTRSGAEVSTVTPVPAISTDDQTRARAQERLQAYREQMAQQNAAAAPASAASAATPPTGPNPNDNSCLAQWQRYDAAYACLDGHRAAGGVVKPEALEKCPVLKQPDCPLPAGMTRR